ncbi:MAG TPA: ribonuclease P protein component [Pseudomonadales bacterium]|nr:ribonuclease P protein component [Pseudomonadales bacterium]
MPDKPAFDRVFAKPDFKLRRHPFLLLARRRDVAASRLGMVIGKKHARRAVARNLIRRIARDRFRHVLSGGEGVDVILMARPGASDCSREQLTEILGWLFEHLARDCSRAAEATPSVGGDRPQ